MILQLVAVSVSADGAAARLARFTLQASVCVAFPQLCLIRRLRRDARSTTARRNNSTLFLPLSSLEDAALPLAIPSVFYLKVSASFMFRYPAVQKFAGPFASAQRGHRRGFALCADHTLPLTL